MKVRLGVSLLSVASPSLCGGVAAFLCILWFPERSCGWCWRALRVFVLLVVAYVLACPGRVGRPFSCGPPPFLCAVECWALVGGWRCPRVLLRARLLASLRGRLRARLADVVRAVLRWLETVCFGRFPGVLWGLLAALSHAIALSKF